MPWKDTMSNNKCEICYKYITKRARRFCSIACYNKSTKVRGITGYKNCQNCNCKFPFRDTLLVRSIYSKKYKCFIASVNQKFCSFKCSIKYNNKFKNPAQTILGRTKISDFAKKRGTKFMLTQACREKQRKTIKGKGHWNWQNGKTSENRMLRNSFECKQWKQMVLKRDSWTCVQCQYKGKGLHVDHIKPWSLYPDLRYDVNNGRVLCIPCHKKTATWGGTRKRQLVLDKKFQ